MYKPSCAAARVVTTASLGGTDNVGMTQVGIRKTSVNDLEVWGIFVSQQPKIVSVDCHAGYRVVYATDLAPGYVWLTHRIQRRDVKRDFIL